MEGSTVASGVSDVKRFTQAFMDSPPVVGFVLILVIAHMSLIFSGHESEPFEIFASTFFVMEVGTRMWAHTLYHFFLGYDSNGESRLHALLNTMDFLLSAMDVVGMVLAYGMRENSDLSAGAKSARITRMVRMLKFLRTIRMWKVVSMFFMVFARERDKKVMARRKKVRDQMLTDGHKAKMNRAIITAATLPNMAADDKWLQGLDLSDKTKKKIDVAEVRRQIDQEVLVKTKVTENGVMRATKPGEIGAHRISLFASSKELSVAFGPVIGMYFWTIELFAFSFLLCFLVSLPSIEYFASDRYSNGTSAQPSTSASLIYATAVCENTLNISAFANRSAFEGFLAVKARAEVAGASQAGAASEALALLSDSLVQTTHNACYLGHAQLVSSALVVFILLVTFIYFYVMFKRDLVRVDESQQTASDYSIIVHDPPVDAFDPEEWRAYFSPYGEVVAVSVCLDNGDLLERLARRKQLKEVIESMPNEQYRPGKLSPAYRWLLNALGVGRDKIYYLEQYKRNEMELAGFLGHNYQVSRVFVSFNTQNANRKAIGTLQQGTLPAALDIAIGLTDDQLFRAGTDDAQVLKLEEAPEPLEIIFMNTGLASPEQRSMQKLVMLLFLAGFMYAEFALIMFLEESSAPWAAGLVITFANSVVPEMLHVLSNIFEVYEVVGEEVESTYNKISLFRYFNTVIIIHLITDWHLQLDQEHLQKVQTILVFDAFLTPFLYAFNFAHLLNRYVMAHFASNELALAHVLSGARVRMSDRYSNVAKTMFVGLFYLPLIPTGALLAFLHCFLACLADRHGLLRNWKPLPPSGAKTLFRVLSTHVAIAMVTHLYMGMVFFSGWTYDSACAALPNDMDHSSGSSNPLAQVFFMCNKHQDGLLKDTQSWMSDEQAATVLLYKVVFVVAFIFGVVLFIVLSRDGIKSLFVSTAKFTDKDQGIEWRNVPEINMYVPKFEVPVFKFPLVVCDMATFGSSHVPWQCEFEKNSLFADAKDLLGEENGSRLFSTCTEYGEDAPPPARLTRGISIANALETENPLRGASPNAEEAEEGGLELTEIAAAQKAQAV